MHTKVSNSCVMYEVSYAHMPDFFFSHIGNLLEIKRNLKECTKPKKKNVPQNVAQASLLQKSDASNNSKRSGDKKRKHQDDQVEAEPKTVVSAPAGSNEKERHPKRPHVQQDEEEEDKVVEVIDLSAKSPSKIKVEPTVGLISESCSATNSDAASSSSMFARPIFFQLYDEATKGLDIAEQTNSQEAIDFYSHLKDFFVRKTKDDEEFDVMSFDPAPIKESVKSFGAILQRLSAAKAQGDGSSVGIYKLEIKTIMKKIKVLLPIRTEVPVKREEEEGDSDEDSLF